MTWLETLLYIAPFLAVVLVLLGFALNAYRVWRDNRRSR